MRAEITQGNDAHESDPVAVTEVVETPDTSKTSAYIPELSPEESLKVTASFPLEVRVAEKMKTPSPDLSTAVPSVAYDEERESLAVTEVLPRSYPATTTTSPEATFEGKLRLTWHVEPELHPEPVTSLCTTLDAAEA